MIETTNITKFFFRSNVLFSYSVHEGKMQGGTASYHSVSLWIGLRWKRTFCPGMNFCTVSNREGA